MFYLSFHICASWSSDDSYSHYLDFVGVVDALFLHALTLPFCLPLWLGCLFTMAQTAIEADYTIIDEEGDAHTGWGGESVDTQFVTP